MLYPLLNHICTIRNAKKLPAGIDIVNPIIRLRKKSLGIIQNHPLIALDNCIYLLFRKNTKEMRIQNTVSGIHTNIYRLKLFIHMIHCIRNMIPLQRLLNRSAHIKRNPQPTILSITDSVHDCISRTIQSNHVFSLNSFHS